MTCFYFHDIQVFSHFRHVILKLLACNLEQNKIPRHLVLQKAHNHMNSVVAERREFLPTNPLICDS